jgi:two-component system, NtrC family, response regulator GlrR
MEQTTVFLVDLMFGSSLGKVARNILSDPTACGLRVLQNPQSPGRRTVSDDDVVTTALGLRPKVVVLVVSAGSGAQARRIVERVTHEWPGLPIMVVSEAGTENEISDLLARGAVDYVVPPLSAIDFLPRIRRFAHHDPEQTLVTGRLKEELGLKQLVGRNRAFLEEVGKIPVVAKSDVGILISGETGTGKELFARAIHYLSPRGGRPFVPVNCGAIPLELVENELFGHVRGAFTGADGSQEGLIHEAERGTLLLDEIDCLPLTAQVKLLRFLQSKEYKRLGSKRMERADVRIIASTNISLQKAAQAGTFRQDLFYRLNVVPLVLPPLRERKDDIPVLARHFLEKYSLALDKGVVNLSPDALRMLMLHSWPGNIRELENVIERGTIFCEGRSLTSREMAFLAPDKERDEVVRPGSFKSAKARAVADFEKEYIKQALLAEKGNITKAALASGKNRRAFWELIRRYRIDVISLVENEPHAD